MTELTPELNLITAEDDDDIADYNVLSLRDTLLIIDGLFNAATGHAHNGSHQGGQLQFLDLTIGEDLTVNGTLLVKQTATFQGAVNAQGVLSSGGLATLQSLDVTTTSRLRGLVTMDAGLNVTGALSNTGLHTAGSLDVTGTSRLRGAVTMDAGLTISGAINSSGTLSVGGLTATGLQVNGNGAVSGTLSVGSTLSALNASFGQHIVVGTWVYTRNGTTYRAWDSADFGFGIPAAANTLVQRDASGQVQANSVYMPSAVQGGKPAHVIGDNGDGWMRRWPISAIGPPALRSYAFTGSIPTHNGNFHNVTISGAGAAGIVVNNGSSLTAVRAGYYSIGATCGGYNNVGVRIYTEGALRADGNSGNPNAPDFIAPIGTNWVGFINAGGLITFTGRSQQAAWNGNFTVTFVPETTYNN